MFTQKTSRSFPQLDFLQLNLLIVGTPPALQNKAQRCQVGYKSKSSMLRSSIIHYGQRAAAVTFSLANSKQVYKIFLRFFLYIISSYLPHCREVGIPNNGFFLLFCFFKNLYCYKWIKMLHFLHLIIFKHSIRNHPDFSFSLRDCLQCRTLFFQFKFSFCFVPRDHLSQSDLALYPYLLP